MSEAPAILTASGLRFPLADPDPGQVDAGDIAHHLANVCRWAGATRRFYSVAEHSCHVAKVALRLYRGGDYAAFFPARTAYLCALLHDGSEAYYGDPSRPLLQLLPEYRDLQEAGQRAVYHAFGLPNPTPGSPLASLIKEADNAMLWAERMELMPTRDPWQVKPPGDPWLQMETRQMVRMGINEPKYHFLRMLENAPDQ